MLELALAVYGLILWLVFKKFKLLPINTWTMVTSALIAVVSLIFVWILLNMFQPVSRDFRIWARTTPVVSQVRGKVTEVAVEENQWVEPGDVLFRLEAEPYEDKVRGLEAKLALSTSLLAQERELLRRGSGTRYEVQRLEAEVGSLEAELDAARFDLEGTVVRAYDHGFVGQVILRPGVMAVPFPIAPAMVFVHAREPVLAATFKQNVIQNIDPGDEAEVAFDAVPGRVFKASVVELLPVMAQGQLLPSGNLVSFTSPHPTPGRLPVLVEVEEDLSSYQLPIGSSGQVAVYTGRAHHLDLVRKIVLRIASWESYVFSP